MTFKNSFLLIFKILIGLILIQACVYAPATEWKPHKANKEPKKTKNYYLKHEQTELK
jgi:hypothetical protein